ncbi:O-antigen ligase family protein [Candidatus Daviesbacteria bacterium]|nr:O-antigen ligase family protein [Candidatus Daviesbacteria bacterium]
MELILISILFLVPLLPPVSGLGYEAAKVVFFITALSFTVLFWVLRFSFGFGKCDKVSFGAPLKVSGLFLLALLISSIFGINPQNSLTGKNPYLQGWILYACLWVFGMFTANFVKNTKIWRRLIFIQAVLISFWALKDWVLIHILNSYAPTYAGRVVSSFGQPNFYSGYLLLCLPLVYPLVKREGRFKLFIWGGVALTVLAIVISGSRAAILVALGLGFALLIYKLRRFKKTAVLLSAALLFLTAFLLAALLQQELVLPADHGWLRSNSPEKRGYIWQVMGEAIAQRPFLGYGLENTDSAYAQFFTRQDFNAVKNPAFYSLKNLVVDRAHSYPLDILMFSGAVGLIAWLFFIYTCFKKAKDWQRVFLIVYLAWTLVQIQSIAHLMLFFFVLGLIGERRRSSGVVKTLSSLANASISETSSEIPRYSE